MQQANTASKAVGRFFRDLRISSGKTQVEVSRYLGYASPSLICAIENGREHLPRKNVEKLCLFLGGNLLEIRKLVARLPKSKKGRPGIRLNQKPNTVSIKGLSINNYLKDLRIRARIGQREAAFALGHSTAQYISNLERGLCDASVEMAIRLSDLYGGRREELYSVFMRIYKAELQKRFGVRGKKSAL